MNSRCLSVPTCSVVLFGLLLSVSPVSGQEQPRFTVQESFATTGKGGKLGPFAYISSMVAAPSGDIWVADSHNEEIVALSARGEQLREIASSGSGPGEVKKPMMMTALPGERGVAVYDAEHLAIELFGPDGAFRERIPLSERPIFLKGFVALSDGRFAMSGGYRTAASSIRLIDREGEAGEGFLTRRSLEGEGRIARRAALNLAGGALARDGSGRLLFSKAAPHRVFRLDLETGERTVLAEDEDLLAYPGRSFYEETESGAWDPSFEYPRSVFVGRLQDGRILNVIRYQERGETLFQLYDGNGQLVDSLRVEKAYTPHALTGDGRLLASYQRPATGEHVATALTLQY
mgnify:CR=1 FL=1